MGMLGRTEALGPRYRVEVKLREGLKKGFLSLRGGGGVSRGQLSLFIFLFVFVPNVLKIISRHKSFFKYRGMGHIKPPPLWSLFFNPSLKNLV